ncbi:hypothetical protein MNBD_GAMMA16-214 [hydrothermal vent metagenome]|uniref:Cytoplasmic protein n=1 Tax=hydrothermal vent metagenome TaxID=652676 RepID=A0A3B0Z975_9ZZZZ
MKHSVRRVIELYESNYTRLLIIIPSLDMTETDVDLTVPGMAGLVVRVLEHCKYTSIVELSNTYNNDARFGMNMTMTLRVYYDAQVAEVTSYQGCRRLRSRYNYPNESMFMPKEKLQVNQFLAEWLEHCLLVSYEQNCLTVSSRS